MALLVVGVVGALLLVGRIYEDAATSEQLEVDLRRLTGDRAGEDAYNLAQTLIAEGVPREEAVGIVAFGGAVVDDPRTARLLAVFEQNAPADASPSLDLVVAADALRVDDSGLWDFLNLVAQEGTKRQLPAEPLAAGLIEHGYEYALGCELVEQAPCPIEVVVQLVLDRQQDDYEQWGHVDCRLYENTAHPGCTTFADCADEYASVLAAQDADRDASEAAVALGHEPGSAGWEEWTAATNQAALSSWETHETCIAERYGDGLDAYKTLVSAR